MKNIEKIYKGLQIIAKYDSDSFVAEHDEIWSGHELERKKMSTEDKKQLKKLQWDWDADIEAWHFNV